MQNVLWGDNYFPRVGPTKQLLLIMKIAAILLLSTCLTASARSDAQNINISLRNSSLEKVFSLIKQQTGYRFLYDDEVLRIANPISLQVKNATLDSVLILCFKDQPLTYKFFDNTIVVSKKDASPVSVPQPSIFLEAAALKISGRVVNESGEPLEGASITIKGKAGGTKTDVNGNFSLDGEASSVLVISFVGYESNEIKIGNRQSVLVKLKATVNTGDQVVVIGYGNARKKDVTGSVASVQLKDQEKTPVVATEQLLEGRVSGVQVSQNQSQPGALFAIRIRGTNSINASSSPLFVIDGYAGGDATYLNPSDVLSIDVLKDASSTAIYGSRGANGVIIITTKRGSKLAPKVTIDAYTGYQQVAKRYKMMDAKQFGTYLNTVTTEDNAINGTTDPLPYTQEQIDGFNKGTDWQKEIFRAAPISNYSLAFNGGNEEERHYLSLNYFDQKGIIKGTGFKRGILRYNLDLNLAPAFKVGISSQLAYSSQDVATVNNFIGSNNPSVLWDAVRFNPVLGPRDSTGAYTYVNGPAGAVLPIGNPIAYINEASNTVSDLSAFTNLFGEYEILKGLKLRVSLGANYDIANRESFMPTDLFYAPGVGDAYQSTARAYNWLSENVLSYEKTINKIHSLNLTAGLNFQHWYNKFYNAEVTELSTNILGVNNFGVGIASPPTSSFTENTLASYFGRVNYRLMGKYLFTATMRADGSSRFGVNDKWGYFPSGAFAWRISEEEFMKRQTTVSDLKMRVSYGVTGNQEIGSYNSITTLSPTSYQLGQVPALVVGIVSNNISNPSLKWESTSCFDGGLDLSLFKNRVSFTADYYYKKTSNLLLNVNLPTTSGYSSILKNVGSVSNLGVEFSVTTVNIDQPKLRWSTTFNLSANRNKVLSLGPNPQIYVGDVGSVLHSSDLSAILIPGKPIGSFYGYTFQGIWQSQDQITKSGTQQAVLPGDPIYRDTNGDSLLTGADRTIIGQALPKFVFGLSNSFSYGRLSLNIFLQGVYGNKIYNENKYEIENGVPGFNKLAYVATKSWHGAGTSNTLPRVSSVLRGSVGVTSDMLEDGSFLRVKTITLSYDLPLSPSTHVFKTANLYVTAQNLLTLTHYSGFDPEVNSFTEANALSLGTDYNAYPNYRSFLLGVKFSF